jgi:hypothetical protein
VVIINRSRRRRFMQKKSLLLLCAGVFLNTTALYAMESLTASDADANPTPSESQSAPAKAKKAAQPKRQIPRPPRQKAKTPSPASSIVALPEVSDQDLKQATAEQTPSFPAIMTAPVISSPVRPIAVAPVAQEEDDKQAAALETLGLIAHVTQPIVAPVAEVQTLVRAATPTPLVTTREVTPTVEVQAVAVDDEGEVKTLAQAAVVDATPAGDVASATAETAEENDGLRVWYGLEWALSGRPSRVEYALSRKHKDPNAVQYLASVDGRHEVGRELDRATQELAAPGLAPDTSSLIRLMSILTQSKAQGVSINLADLQNAHAKIKAVKTEATNRLNTKLSNALVRFLADINQDFKAQTDLIAALASLQHTAAQMRRDLNNDPENPSDDEENPKGWDMEEVFAELGGINTAHHETTLGVAISLNQELEEVN